MKRLMLLLFFVFFNLLYADQGDAPLTDISSIEKNERQEDIALSLNCMSPSQAPILEKIEIVSKREDIDKTHKRCDQNYEVDSFLKNPEESYVYVNAVLPGDGKNFRKKLERKYLRCELTKETIANIKSEILNYYIDQGFPFTKVRTPKQVISSGSLVIEIYESTVGKIVIKDNKWTKTSNIKKYIRLKEGEKINTRTVDDDLFWLNRDPFQQIFLIYEAGEEPLTTDLDFVVSDRIPFRLYSGIDNTGNHVTGVQRFYAGLNAKFSPSQRVNFQYTASYDFKSLTAYTGQYYAKLPWRHELEFLGGYSRVHARSRLPGLTANMEKVKTTGFSAQVSMRYLIPLKSYKTFLHDWSWGMDFKRTNNNLDLGGVPILAGLVNLTQLMLNYNTAFTTRNLDISWEIEGYWSPGRIVSDQTDALYRELRPFAKIKYGYWRSTFSLNWLAPHDFRFLLFLRGQYATNNLLPSEEYGLGGYNTVRGYDERIVNGDNAFVGNIELHMPAFSILKGLCKHIKAEEKFRFLAFFDYGMASQHKAIPDSKKFYHLYSAGPGIDYKITPYLFARVDWGFKIKHIPQDTSTQKVHFSLIGGF